MHNPGWVDLQVNGCVGVDFSDPELTEEAFLRAADYVWNAGTAVFLPTLITSPPAVYRRNLPLIRNTIIRHRLEARIPGVHLEGPFLAPGAAGAHNPTWLQPPAPAALKTLLDIAPGLIRLVTLAPESPGATEAIRLLRERKIAVSLGHTLATTAQIIAAAETGAQALTHLGNGIPTTLPRHENPIWAGLAEERLTAMLITDGHHLPEPLIRVICKVKGAGKIIVTSDASPAAGFAPGPYRVLGNDAILEPGGKLYNPATGFLVGSSVMLADCMRYLESLNIFSKEELQKAGRDNALALISTS